MVRSQLISVECCGRRRRTPYCGACGQRLSFPPLVELRAYCRQQVRLMSRTVTSCRKAALRPDLTPAKAAWYKRRADRMEDTVGKFVEWAEALLQVKAQLPPKVADALFGTEDYER